MDRRRYTIVPAPLVGFSDTYYVDVGKNHSGVIVSFPQQQIEDAIRDEIRAPRPTARCRSAHGARD